MDRHYIVGGRFEKSLAERPIDLGDRHDVVVVVEFGWIFPVDIKTRFIDVGHVGVYDNGYVFDMNIKMREINLYMTLRGIRMFNL